MSARLFRSIREGVSWSGFETNALFLAMGGGEFSDVSHASGFDFPDDGRGMALVDWDGDGDLDVITTNRNAPQIRILQNNVPSKDMHWLGIRLHGDGSVNSDAIGARVSISLKGQPAMIRTVRAGEGFQTQNSKWLHFGLGEFDTIESVRVDWPGGKSQRFFDLKVNHRYDIHYGYASAIVEEKRIVRDLDKDLITEDLVDEIPGRVLTASKLPVLPVFYKTLDGETVRNSWKKDSGVSVLTFWTSWCPLCEKELANFNKQFQKLNGAGISVLALSVDGVGPIEGSNAAAVALAKKLKLQFPVGMASQDILDQVEILHDLVFEKRGRFNLPTTLVIDAQSQLSAFYEGPLEVDELLEISRWVSYDQSSKNAVAHLPFKGKRLVEPLEFRLTEYGNLLLKKGFYLEASALLSRFRPRFQVDSNYPDFLVKLGLAYEKQDDLRGALRHFSAAVRLRPKNIHGWMSLGSRQMAMREDLGAIESFQTALKLKSNVPEAHYNIGIVQSRMFQLKDALKSFQAELKRDPKHVLAKANVAGVFLRQNQPLQAITALEEVLVLKADFHEARLQLAKLYEAQNDVLKAEKHYKILAQMKPDFLDAR